MLLISETLAKRVWPHDDPIGRCIRFGVDIPNNEEPWLPETYCQCDQCYPCQGCGKKASLVVFGVSETLKYHWLEWVVSRHCLLLRFVPHWGCQARCRMR